LDFIEKLKPVYYQLKEEPGNAKGKVYEGFIAQDVRQTIQELGITFGGLYDPPNVSEEEKTLGLDYSKFVVPLVNAVKEQQREITDLKQRLDKLEKIVNKIELKKDSDLEN